MARKTTIGDNPLNSLIPQSPNSATATLEPAGQNSEGGIKSQKSRATFYLSEDILEEVRNAAVYLSGPPTRLTLTEFADSAFRNEVERLKREHNGGKPFPQRQP